MSENIMSNKNDSLGSSIGISDFYKSVAEGIIVIDRKGKVLYSNYTADTIFHLKDDVFQGKRFMDCIEDHSSNDGLKDAITDALFSETHKITRKVNYRNQEKKYVFILSSVYVSSENYKGIIITFSDITELDKLKKTEKRLQMEVAKNEELTKQNAILTEAFDNHLDDDVVEQLLNSPEGIGTHAMTKEMSLFMLMSPDLQGMVTAMNPKDYLEMLNHYYDLVIPIIKKNCGTIFELHSDSIVVGFGAPKNTEDHADHALLAACEIQKAMAQMIVWNQEKAYPRIGVRIGIHTGEFPIGVIGGTGVLKYNVFGRNINFTARMTTTASTSEIVISESARKALKGKYIIHDQYEFISKGISQPVKAYKVRLA